MQPIVEVYFTELDSYRFYILTGKLLENGKFHGFPVSEALSLGTTFMVRGREASERANKPGQGFMHQTWLEFSNHALQMGNCFIKLVAELAITTQEENNDEN